MTVAGLGILRSLVVYRRPGRQGALRRMYRPFVSPGDLVFDVGAHLGDRTAAFVALGARVVALEPQPAVRRWLQRLEGRSPAVVIRPEAVGPRKGTASLAVSRRHPTVSTLAHRWRAGIADRNAGFRGVDWDASVEVPVTTLDALVEEHGRPAFCKVDVEGFEAEVLAGLSTPLPALSVEFVGGSLEVAVACVERLESLASYRYNAVRGEGRRFVRDRWMEGREVLDWLEKAAEGIASGDLYARLPGAGGGSP